MADIYLKDRGGTPIKHSSVQKIKVPKDSAAGSFEEFCLTTDADATANDIATGKTAYVDGVKLTGTKAEPSGTKYIINRSLVNVKNYAWAGISNEDSELLNDSQNIKNGVTILGTTGTYTGETPYGCIRYARLIEHLYVNSEYPTSDMLTYLVGLTYDSNNQCILFRSGLAPDGNFEVIAEHTIADLYEINAVVYDGTAVSSTNRVFGLDYDDNQYKFFKPYNFNLTLEDAGSYVISYVKDDMLSFIDILFSRTGIAFGKHYTDLQTKSVTITQSGTTSVSADSGYDGLQSVNVTVSGLGSYAMVTLDAVSAVFTHPLINSTYMPRALFNSGYSGGTFEVSTSGLYVDGSALGMGTGMLNCIGYSGDGDCTALYSANFKQSDSSELTANATIVYDTTEHTITVTHFEANGVDLSQYVSMVSMKMWVIVPAALLQ